MKLHGVIARAALCAVLPAAALPACATDLWNQQAGLPAAFASFPDQEFDDGLFDIYTTYMANDVEVGAGGWIINSVSVEVQASQPSSFVSVTTGRLNIFANTANATTPGALDDPTMGQSVAVSITPVNGQNNGFFVTATNLNITLGAGEYWIDLTPIGGIATAGESLEDFSKVNLAGALMGTAVINPGQGYSFPSGPNWDTLQHANKTLDPQYGAIDIQGIAAPEPATIMLLTAGAACFARRRRKA